MLLCNSLQSQIDCPVEQFHLLREELSALRQQQVATPSPVSAVDWQRT